MSNMMSSLLMMLDEQIIGILIKKSGIDYVSAASLLYNSELYSKLEDEGTKLWHFSAETLYSMLNEELTTGSITYPEEQ